jgi:RND family efflux transporter MFP subunit
MRHLQWGITLVALGAVPLLAGCGGEPPLAETEPPVVTVSKPLIKDITDYDVYTGRLEAAEEVEVRARVFGELKKIHFKDGAMVKAGEPLFDIDDRTYLAALKVAEAKKANAEASVEFASNEYDRNRELMQSKAASAKDVAAWLAKKNVSLAEQQQAEAEIERAKLDVEFTKIKAPISGKISLAKVTEGNMVNAGASNTLLTTIVSVDPMYVYFDVDEPSLINYRKHYAKYLADKDKTPPVIPAYLGLITDGDTFPREGKIDFADNKVNPSTGTIRVRAVFPNKDGMLTPGLFGRVKLPVGEEYKGLLVTDQAVGIDQGQKYLLIVNSENKKVEYRAVKPGRLEGDLRIFPPDSGLKAGEWVIVNGVQRVRPGIVCRAEDVRMPGVPTAKGEGKAKK